MLNYEHNMRSPAVWGAHVSGIYSVRGFACACRLCCFVQVEQRLQPTCLGVQLLLVFFCVRGAVGKSCRLFGKTGGGSRSRKIPDGEAGTPNVTKTGSTNANTHTTTANTTIISMPPVGE